MKAARLWSHIPPMSFLKFPIIISNVTFISYDIYVIRVIRLHLNNVILMMTL